MTYWNKTPTFENFYNFKLDLTKNTVWVILSVFVQCKRGLLYCTKERLRPGRGWGIKAPCVTRPIEIHSYVAALTMGCQCYKITIFIITKLEL